MYTVAVTRETSELLQKIGFENGFRWFEGDDIVQYLDSKILNLKDERFNVWRDYTPNISLFDMIKVLTRQLKSKKICDGLSLSWTNDKDYQLDIEQDGSCGSIRLDEIQAPQVKQAFLQWAREFLK